MHHRPCLAWPCHLILLLLAAAAAGAHAGEVYRCRDAGGRLSFQDRPCADGAQQSRVVLAPLPPPAASPDYGVADARMAGKARREARRPARRHDGSRAEAVSWECRAADGEVFYRHGACPRSVTNAGAAGRRGGGPVAVSGIALPRAEACRRLAAADGVGRAGRARDEQVSTYERNAGRDPCRNQ